MVALGNDWDALLQGEWEKPYYKALRAFLKEEYQKAKIFPSMHNIFNALKQTPFAGAKVVLLGQDPYHNDGQAHGLAFSVEQGALPPSLQNIFKELTADIGCPQPTGGNLLPWAKQGVLLLNTVLTVRAHQPFSHAKKGWEQFTDHVISLLGQSPQPRVFLLWGAKAQSKKDLIGPGHCVLACAHPSPLSASGGFFGCRHFSKANSALEGFGVAPVDWRLP